MANCRNFFLLAKDLFADTAVRNFHSFFFTGSCFYHKHCFCMTQCRNLLLLFQSFAADGTMTSFRFSWCFTGGGCCLIGYFFCVSGWRNFFLFFQYFAAGLAMAAFGLSGFFAGWSYGFIDHCFMICYRKLFMAVQNFVAGVAVYQGISRFLTGRCFCYHFRFFVSLRWRFFLNSQYFTADCTMASFGFS